MCVPLVPPPPQALELRESCVCPALPAADPRAVFSKSVQVLLEKDKGRGEQGGGGMALRTGGLPSVPAGLPAALLAPNSVPTSSKVAGSEGRPSEASDPQAEE